MFIAVGLDVSREPCQMLVMERTGRIVECLSEERCYERMAFMLETIAVCHSKIVFCAISSSDGQEFQSFSPWLKERRAHLITCDDRVIEGMERTTGDLRNGVPQRAYCLAKIAQAEGLELFRRHEDIKKLYEMRETLDRLLIRLSTKEAFPDEYFLMQQW
jgi:hypothetical protein